MLADYWQTSTTAGANHPDAATPRIARLQHLELVSFTGADVLNFLQGYLTSDLLELAEDHWQLTALTNLKGRVVANGWCRQVRETEIDWVVDRTLIEHLQTFMRPYLAFSKTTLTTDRADHLVLGLCDTAPPSIALVTEPGELDTLLATHQPVTPETFHRACIDARVALVNDTTSEQFLPQMLGLVEQGAVDFNKGCYLGQEVVARAQHRGEVKRKLTRLQTADTDTEVLVIGAALTDGTAREVGVVVSELAEGHCLAVMRSGTASEYQCGPVTLTVID